MLFNAFLSDDENHVLLFREGEDEPEEYTVSEFIQFFGDEELAKLQEEFEKAHQVVPDAHEMSIYYDAFLKFLKVDGKYVHDIKLYSNSIDGSEHANAVINDYFDSSREKLMSQVMSLRTQHAAAIESLNYWLKRVGLKPIPHRTSEGVIPPNRFAIEDLTNLFHSKCIVRERMTKKIREHQRDSELLSPEEIVEETLLSFRIVKHHGGEGATLQELIALAHKVL